MSTIDAGPRGDVIVLATSFQKVTASAARAAVAHPVDIRAVNDENERRSPCKARVRLSRCNQLSGPCRSPHHETG